MAPADKKPTLSALGIPALDSANGDKSNGLSSPTDSEIAEKNLAALESKMNTMLQISTNDTTSHTDNPSSYSPDFSSDPLSATALTSPLHTVNWDQISAGRNNSINGIANMSTTTAAAAVQGSFDSYKRAGPRPPPSLEKLIMDYHHRHSKSWQLAHDMGAGSSVFAPTIARYFRHVHVSDPTSTGMASSRRVLSTWAADNRRSRGRFTFSSGIPERGHEHMADGSVDLVFIMQGAHHADPHALALSAAESLSQNGTLAIVNYSPVCRVTGNPRADAAVQGLFAAWGTAPWDVVCGDARGKAKFSLGLDFIPLPESVFALDKTRRITINAAAGGKSFAVPDVARDNSESRVRPSERRHDYTAEDEQAKGWRQEVGPEFFRSMTAALLGASGAQQFEKNFREIADIVHETSPNGILITVEWSVEVVLATKK